MAHFLYPNEHYTSTYLIDFEHYYHLGYRAILFDIDNTLVPHNAMSDERSRTLLEVLRRMGFSLCFVSNNKEPRVANFAEELQVEGLPDVIYVYKAGKPKKWGYLDAIHKLKVRREATLFVGDQLFTDIWGANNAGVHSILVRPIDKKEEIQIRLKRILEKPILWFYQRHHTLRG